MQIQKSEKKRNQEKQKRLLVVEMQKVETRKQRHHQNLNLKR